MGEEMMAPPTRSAIGIAVMAAMSSAVIAAPNLLYHAMKGPVTTNQPEVPLVDGAYVYEVPELNSRGYKDRTTVMMPNGIIVPCVWDSFDTEGNGRQKLNMDGQHVMTDNGPTWKAQADSVGKYAIEHQKIKGLANQEGYITDAIPTVNINVCPFINEVEGYLKQAAE